MSGWRWSSTSPALLRIIRSSRAPAAFVRLAGPGEAREERRLSRGLFLFGRTGAHFHGFDLRQVAKGDSFGSRSERACKACGADQESSKGRTMIMGVRTLNAGTKRRTRLGLALEQSAK